MAAPQQKPPPNSQDRRQGHAMPTASRSTSFDRRTRSDVDSWVEVSSQPSSSSLSSINDEIVTTGLRVQDDPRTRRRRVLRSGIPTQLNITRTPSAEATSSQEEYEESESEEDRVLSSSGEGPILQANPFRANNISAVPTAMSDDDDENRTAINYPIRGNACFTPQPNAFSHPPSAQGRPASQPVSSSYFPATRTATANRPSTRHSLPAQPERRQSHLPQNLLSPSYNAAAEHEEALRASLNSLLSVAAAARGLSTKADSKRPTPTTFQPRSNRIEPGTFRLVPESALNVTSPQQEPTFQPTIRRTSTTSLSTASELLREQHKRKATPRNSSRERRALKKARRLSSSEDLVITPTLLTWVVSAGVVVFLSALSFSAGYSLGKEAGRMEVRALMGDEQLRSCAREAGRSSLGLKRSLARSAIQA